ncbi:Putative NADPH-quinone reductase (modulator of drug activity B) [Myroides marinus]|uniref:Putative NADPH-quinone reductase (Modulator of drug activity B) n=1 Tax=Myroides marinus TaxID=703342 RepID=A0A1H6W2V7_9FLAO|nr:NAD(P)H-dependent oxidoreductase [Myroides marinus]SEJ07160.1 Putative NADPH-quinone reductase (modulator of drug activity B) [Myroides marinus]
MTTNKIKRILVINGHPDPDSYNQALAQSYLKELETHLSIQIRYLALHTLEFNPNLEYGYRKRTELEPDLLLALEDIKWADHMVWIHPLWWLGLPALMKGFFDRAFLPGITFVHHSSDNTEVLLLGKTARIITTGGDLNKEIYNDVYKQSGLIQLKEGILEYCGVHVTDTTFIGPMNDLTANDRLWWLNEVKNYAFKDSQH